MVFFLIGLSVFSFLYGLHIGASAHSMATQEVPRWVKVETTGWCVLELLVLLIFILLAAALNPLAFAAGAAMIFAFFACPLKAYQLLKLHGVDMLAEDKSK